MKVTNKDKQAHIVITKKGTFVLPDGPLPQGATVEVDDALWAEGSQQRGPLKAAIAAGKVTATKEGASAKAAPSGPTLSPTPKDKSDDKSRK